jgi:hypothetical protein
MTIESELPAILDNDPDDIFRVEVAHDWARDNPDSYLHRHLIWDDAKAGREYRFNQIRKLVKIYLVDEHRQSQVISLIPDRVAGGGYRRVADVMSVPELAQIAVQETLADLHRVQRRYEHLVRAGRGMGGD